MSVNKGRTMNLTCIVHHSPEPPPAIYWTHNEEESVHEEAVGMDETLQDSPEMPLTQPDPDKRVNEEEADEDGDGDGGNEESGSGSGSDGGDISMTESEVLESAKAEPENLVLQHAANSILQERAAAKLAQQQQESSKDNKRGSEKRRQSGDDLQTPPVDKKQKRRSSEGQVQVPKSKGTEHLKACSSKSQTASIEHWKASSKSKSKTPETTPKAKRKDAAGKTSKSGSRNASPGRDRSSSTATQPPSATKPKKDKSKGKSEDKPAKSKVKDGKESKGRSQRFNLKKLLKESDKFRAVQQYRCPYCLELLGQRSKMIEHCVTAHPNVVETAELSGLKALNLRIENLSKRGVRTLDRATYSKHLLSLKKRLDPSLFSEIDVTCRCLLLECMVLIGDPETYDAKNYMQLRQSYSTLLCKSPVWRHLIDDQPELELESESEGEEEDDEEESSEGESGSGSESGSESDQD